MESAQDLERETAKAMRGAVMEPGALGLSKAVPNEVYDQLVNQINRLEHMTTDLAVVLGPVLIQGGTSPDTRPEEVPYHDYHNLVLRFQRLNDKLGETIQLIKL